MILLWRPREAWLAGFGMAGGLCAGVTIALVAWALGSPWLIAGAVFAAAVPGSVAVLRPQALNRWYGLWNRAARRMLWATRWLLMRVCFYVTFVAVGWTGSRLALGRVPQSESCWVPRGTLSPSAYGSPDGALEHWTRGLAAWAMASKNYWALFLLPMFMLLSILKVEDSTPEVPPNLYALF